MTIKSILLKIDKILCTYFGFNDEEKIKPNTVELVKDQIFISHSTSFTRHSLKEPWENFSNLGIHHIEPEEKEKLGLALGKAIAEQLVISFEETTIKEP